MENKLKVDLEKFCTLFNDKLESLLSDKPIGACYLIGHALAEGFKRTGYIANEISGTAIFKDKFENNIIYGKSVAKGKNIGLYHTWCTLEIDNETIIIDPSYKYNKIAIEDYYKIKPNKNINDIIITNKANNWLFTYIEDSSLKVQSKKCLDRIDNAFLEQLILETSDLVINVFGYNKFLK